MDMSMGMDGSGSFEIVFFPSILLPRPLSLGSHFRFCTDLRYLLIGRGGELRCSLQFLYLKISAERVIQIHACASYRDPDFR